MKQLNNIARLFTLMMLALPVIIPNKATAHWTSKGPYGGSVKCITIADTNVLVGTYKSGVFINTTPAANVWKAYNTGMTSGMIGAVAQLGRKTIAGTPDAGIFISDDRGVNWAQSNSGLTTTTVQAMQVSGANVFAGTTGGVFLSTDSGKNWTLVSSGLTNHTVNCFTVNGSDIYAGTDGGVFVSNNNGSSWSSVNTGLINQHVTSLVMANGNLFAASSGGVYQTGISAINWLAASTGISGNVTCLYDAGGTLYAGSSAGLFSTGDVAIVWNLANTGLPADTVNAIGVYAGKVYAGTQRNGVYSSPVASISFATNQNGFNGLKTRALAAMDTLVVIAATEKGIHRSVDLAANYTMHNAGIVEEFVVNCMSFAGTKLFAGTEGGVIMSTDTGRSWANISAGIGAIDVKAIVATDTQLFVAGAGNTIFVSSLKSISWTQISTGLPANITISGLVVNAGKLFASTVASGVYAYNGATWTTFNAGLISINVNCITSYKSRIYVGTQGGGVFVSPAAAEAWMPMNDSLPSLNITAINAADSYVIAGYRGGVKFTSDNGKYWLPPSVELFIPTYADVTSIAFTAQRIFIATPYNSLYSNAKSEVPAMSSIPTLGINDLVNSRPAAGNIIISPNPNNGNFDINIAIAPGDAIKDVLVYDVTGKIVDRLKNLKQQSINANYNTGIYFINVTTDKGRLTQKMIVQ